MNNATEKKKAENIFVNSFWIAFRGTVIVVGNLIYKTAFYGINAFSTREEKLAEDQNSKRECVENGHPEANTPLLGFSLIKETVVRVFIFHVIVNTSSVEFHVGTLRKEILACESRGEVPMIYWRLPRTQRFPKPVSNYAHPSFNCKSNLCASPT